MRHRLTATVAAAVLLLGGVLVSSAAAQPSTGEFAAATASGWCPNRERLVILGDSGSTGYGSPDYPAGAQTYKPTANGWSSIVSRNLAAEPTWRTQTTVIAHGGAQAADFLPGGRWPDTVGAVEQVRQTQPTMVVIALGGNEFYIDKDPQQFAAEYDQLVRSVHATAPGATIMLLVEWELGARQSAGAVHTWQEYTGEMRKTAAAGPHGMIDLRQYLPRASQESGLYMADNIHPNQFGQRVVGAAMWSFFVWSC
jgi:acyl-CoA thioesterase-1